MDPALLDMLTDTVTHEPYTGQNAYGVPQYGSPVQLPARVAYRVATLTNAQGQERTSQTTVYLNGDVEVSVRDRLTLPDGSKPAIQNIYSPSDPLNPGVPDHHEIML